MKNLTANDSVVQLDSYRQRRSDIEKTIAGASSLIAFMRTLRVATTDLTTLSRIDDKIAELQRKLVTLRKQESPSGGGGGTDQ